MAGRHADERSKQVILAQFTLCASEINLAKDIVKDIEVMTPMYNVIR